MATTPQTAKSIFLEAVEKYKADQWEAYLDGVCGDDADLRLRVEDLLKAHRESDSLLDQLDATVDLPQLSESSGAVIGPYRLMEQIGEGGMGLVFVAEQQKPLQRKVALKLIKPGMDTKAVVARFEAERQALAMMDHPNIAKVLDAGTTDSGHPYFAMELVKGISITDYCDQNKLTIRERLELFVQVCQAIQHAHQKGIIHRDIKPSNVLVTLHDGNPVPKVIDFGVAKALNTRLTDRTVYTEHLQIVGTLLYMSPEQAELSGLDIDTRTDVFSLGVLLYELITGTTPFTKEEMERASFDELRRLIREQTPPKASQRISSLGETVTSVAQSRRSDPRKLQQLVRGELDWIVLCAMEKDRRRRYESASAFAADICRLLKNRPIDARPPSSLYRVRKFAARNKAGIAVTILSMAVLCAIVVGSWQARRRSEAESEYTALFLDAINNDLLQGNIADARKKLKLASDLRISDSDRQTMEAQVRLFNGDFRDALGILEEARSNDQKNVAINAMLAIAHDKNADDERHFEIVKELTKQQECTSFSDYLLRGWALSTFFPEKGIEDLRKALDLQPTSHMAMLKYAEASLSGGARSLDAEEGLRRVEEAIDLLKGTRNHFPDSQVIRAHLVWGYMTASDRCRELGRPEQKISRLLPKPRRRICPSRPPESLVMRTHFFHHFDKHNRMLADFKDLEKTRRMHNSLAWQSAVVFYRRHQYGEALDALHATSPIFRDSFAFFMRAFVLADKTSRELAANELSKGRTERGKGIYRALDWAAYRFLGEAELADAAARDARKVFQKYEKPEWLIQTEFMLGEKSPTQMLNACTNRFDLTYSHFYIAVDALGKGDRERARKHLQKAVDLGVFRSFGHRWSAAFLARIESDETWPAWSRPGK